MHTILFPTDFTADCDLAFQIACGIARDEGCEIIILHVVHPDRCSKQDLCSGEINHESAFYRDCWAQFAQLQALASDIPMRFQLKVGHLVETMIGVADAESCDAIVVASHPHSYHHRQILGSVSKSLARRCQCPIVCLSPPGSRQEETSMLTGLRKEFLAKTVAPGHSAT